MSVVLNGRVTTIIVVRVSRFVASCTTEETDFEPILAVLTDFDTPEICAETVGAPIERGGKLAAKPKADPEEGVSMLIGS